MRHTALQPSCLVAVLMLMLTPLAALAYQDSTASASSSSTTAVLQSNGLLGPVNGLPDFSPPAIRKVRVELYFQAAREALVKLAPQVYKFASNSERCRLNSGAKACDLPAEPLKGSDLKQIFKYYVKGPVEAALAQQQLDVHKSDWTWQPYFNHRNN